jgi:hypothetical protein
MSDLPENVDLQWLGRAILALRADIAEIKTELAEVKAELAEMKVELTAVKAELAAQPSRREVQDLRDELIASMRSELSRLNDGDMVSLAVVNRMDGTLISVLAEMRTLRTRFDGIGRRREALERQS